MLEAIREAGKRSGMDAIQNEFNKLPRGFFCLDDEEIRAAEARSDAFFAELNRKREEELQKKRQILAGN